MFAALSQSVVSGELRPREQSVRHRKQRVNRARNNTMTIKKLRHQREGLSKNLSTSCSVLRFELTERLQLRCLRKFCMCLCEHVLFLWCMHVSAGYAGTVMAGSLTKSLVSSPISRSILSSMPQQS